MKDDHARTLAILKQMAEGKQLTVKIGDNNYKLGMGEDMSVGIIFTSSDGTEHISGLSTMSLAEFNSFLTKHNIGIPL